MLFYDKRIAYLSYMEDGVRVRSAGYAKIEVRDKLFAMDMHVNVKGLKEIKKCEIIVQAGVEYISIGMIYLEDGLGSCNVQFPAEEIGRHEIKIPYEKLEMLKIIIDEKFCIEGKIPVASRTEKPSEKSSEKLSEEVSYYQPEIQASQDVRRAESRRTFTQAHDNDVRRKLEEVRLTPGKWQQLLKDYKQIHPYGDERLYISIEPKDFVILREEYQHLTHNSFLLHGFYNYRHIILGIENQEGSEQSEEVFYLGVPGVFYEREKMVALMFGFEAFECEGGKPQNGKFGYYLKKVSI